MTLACLVGVVLMHDKFSAKKAVGVGFSNGFNSWSSPLPSWASAAW